MEPLEMMLVDAVLHHLQIVAVHQSRAQRSHSVLSHQHIIARQERPRLGTEVGKNDPRQFLNFIGALTNAIFKAALWRFTRLLQHPPINIVKPAMIATAQAAILDMAELEGSPAVQAPQLENTEPAAVIAEKNQVFT